MMRWLRKVFLVAVMGAAMPSLQAIGSAARVGDAFLPQGLAAGRAGRVVAIIDGETLTLDDGRTLRLSGIQVPRPPGPQTGERAGKVPWPPGVTTKKFPWPPGGAAKKALLKMAMGKTVTPYFGTARRDRYGRVPAQLVGRDGVWLQGRMLALGLARVYGVGDNGTLAHRALIQALYACERTARAARRGIWSQPFYALRRPDTVGADIGSFQVVEGRVRDVAVVKKTAYLNFGSNWRTDFTVKIPENALKRYRGAHGNPLALKGRMIRVRGWIGSENGPMIILNHPEALEVVADSGDGE